MAHIVAGIGASHTPLLTLDSEQWKHRASVDYANTRLNTSDGRWLSYADLLAEVGPRYSDVVSLDILHAKAATCAAALKRLAAELVRARPDTVIIIGDDQAELFGPANQPLIAIYHGEEIAMSNKYGYEESPDWIQTMGRGYLMDDLHRVPGNPLMARQLISNMVDLGVDVSSVASVVDPVKAGFGHAYGFIFKRLMRGMNVPVVPVLLNTYFSPNVPTSARAFDIGQALAQAVQNLPGDERVAIVASGGLSHFVVDEQLDRGTLRAMEQGDVAALRSIPRGSLNSGSSEILNWITMAGALHGNVNSQWTEYIPLYRTPAGTGVGAAFACWNSEPQVQF